MDKFDGLGRGLPSLGRNLARFAKYARRQEMLGRLECRPGGKELVVAIRRLIEAYDGFVAPTHERVVIKGWPKGGGEER